MTFTGKPGDLTIEEILGIIHASIETRILKVEADSRVFYLHARENRLIAIGRPGVNDELHKMVESDSQSSKISTNSIIQNLSESVFFEFLELPAGRFEWISLIPEDLLDLDVVISDWIASLMPDVNAMTQFRKRYPDFDIPLKLSVPPDNTEKLRDVSSNEFQLLTATFPFATPRTLLTLQPDDLRLTTEMIGRLGDRGLISERPPEMSSDPDDAKMLHSMLSIVLARLVEINRLFGNDGELFGVLQLISSKLDHFGMERAHISFSHDELGDLVGLTGDLEGLLDLNGVEELNLQQEMETSNRASSIPPKPRPQPEVTPDKRSPKAGVKRQPMKSDATEKDDPDLSLDLDKSKREMVPDPKRQEEAAGIIQASLRFDRDTTSMEEKVEAKVRYRKLTSNVTMAYNRYVMTNQTLFEMLGLLPNAEKKTIHKAFVKAIESINPKGIRFRSLDQGIIEKAIYLRDVYKKAYIILMDDEKKRRYVGGMRKDRQAADENKTQAMRLFNVGMEKVRLGKFDEARTIFVQAAKLDPNSPVYYSVLEDIDKEEREGNAVKFFQAGILAFKQKNDYERAIQLIRKAISLRPLDPTYHLKLAEIQLLSGKYKEDAITTYLHALDLDPGNQDLRLTIANLVKNVGRKQEAANMYQVILKWNPDNTVVKKFLLELQKEGIKPVQDAASKSKEKKDTVINEEFE